MKSQVSVDEAVKTIEQSKDGICVLPIGGCGEFGINMTLYSAKGDHYLVDCGLMFPDSVKLGVDAIIPDLAPLFSKLGAPKAYLITHGHEDHIGALPYIHRRWPAPVYCTAWTAELIIDKFNRSNLDAPEIHVVKAKDRLKLGHFTVDWVHVNHSIPMCCSLIIRANGKIVVHTGDFKFDDHSLYEPKMLEEDFAKLLPNGCDLLLADSTNATSTGDCPSEINCLQSFEELFPTIKGNIYLTTFSSNLWRIRSILDAAKKARRKVHFAGAGMEKTASIARKLHLFPEQTPDLLDVGQIKLTESKNRVIVCTGCQGEPLSALARIVRNEHAHLRFKPDDVVIFSSRIIPGSERQVYHMMSECARRGIAVFTVRDDARIHVSGHAYQGDLKRLITATKPRQLLAVHGTFSQLEDHTEFVNKDFAKRIDTTMGEDGTVYHLSDSGFKELCEIDVDWLYIDGFVKAPISNSNLKQRLKIGELGLVVFSGVFSNKDGDWLGEVFLDLKGLELPQHIDHNNWYEACKNKATRAIESAYRDGIDDDSGLNEAVRIGLRQHFATVFKKKVVVTASVHRI